MDQNQASVLSKQLLGIIRDLDRSVAIAQAGCTEEEFNSFRRLIGGVMAEVITEILTPIFVEFPEVCPPELERKPAGQRNQYWVVRND